MSTRLDRLEDTADFNMQLKYITEVEVTIREAYVCAALYCFYCSDAASRQ
jgi:hypothetical protein